MMMRVLVLVLAFAATASAQQIGGTAGLGIRDEGVNQGRALTLDCTGTGVGCTVSGSVVTVNVTGGGSGAPTDAAYWVGAAHADLSAEINLGALGTGLVLNTGGTPSIAASNTCTTQFARSSTASGVWTCASIADADVPNTITIDLAALATALATPRTIGNVSFNGTANIVPETIAVIDSTDATSSIAMFDSATGSLQPKTDGGLTYAATTGMLTATGLTGPLTGNASTATALATDPSDCAAGTVATAIAASGNLTCVVAGAQNWMFVAGTSGTGYNPVDNTNFYILLNVGSLVGNPQAAATTAIASFTGIAVTACTLRSVYTSVYSFGAGSTETGLLVFRLNNTTDTTIESGIVWNGAPNNYTETGLSIALSAGDFFQFYFDPPTWVTNPTVTFYLVHAIATCP